MDNIKRQTPDIYGLFVFSALVMMALSGCGGGGGGSSRLAVTEPPASALPPRPSLATGLLIIQSLTVYLLCLN